MTHWLMRVIGFANDRPCHVAGQYLKTYTPDEKIKGTFTNDPGEAMQFASPGDLLETWKHSIGTRPDGKPDRPLTAFTIETVRREDEKPAPARHLS